MHKQYLMAPGPTPVPEAARLAMARQLIHHRGEEFRELMAEVRAGLQWLFETDSDVLALTCSGTGAFEAAITNFTSRDQTLIAVGGGKFGERWGEVGRAFGMKVVDVELEWGKALSPSHLRKVLEANPEAAMVTLTASETSTGVMHPVKELAQVVREHSEALLAVDGITAVGVHRLPMDEWNVDILVAGSQKAFGIPPGLGFLAAGERAWERAESSDHPRYYFDLPRERRRQRDNQTAFTPAISIVIALREVLTMMRSEGLEALVQRHTNNAAATRAGVEALGLQLLAESFSNAVTAALLPQEVSAIDVVRRMREEHGIIIAGGQGDLKGRLIRIGHIGFFEASDIRMALGALESVLRAEGVEVSPGEGMAAAQEIFLSK